MSTALSTIRRGILRDLRLLPGSFRLEDDSHSGVQRLGNAAQGAQGMTGVSGRLQPADLLLNCGGIIRIKLVPHPLRP